MQPRNIQAVFFGAGGVNICRKAALPAAELETPDVLFASAYKR